MAQDSNGAQSPRDLLVRYIEETREALRLCRI